MQPEYFLHKLPEGFIITSENPTEGDLIWYNNTLGKLIFTQDDLGQGYEIEIGIGVSYPIYEPLNVVKKVIAKQLGLSTSAYVRMIIKKEVENA